MIDGDEQKELFVFDDEGRDLPIPIFSSVTPNNPIPFILHVMLILGKYETELDFWLEPSLRESLAKIGLIPSDFSEPSLLEGYSNCLVRICVEDVFSIQPVSLRKLDDYVVKAKILFDSIILRNEIPSHDIPPCIYTD